MSEISTRPDLAGVEVVAELMAEVVVGVVDLPPSLVEGVFVSFPDSPFQLVQPYPPAGDQPAAIDQLVEGLEDGLAYQTLLGVTGSGKTFTIDRKSVV